VKNAFGKWKSFLPFKAVSSLVLYNIHKARGSSMSETYPPGQLGLPIALNHVLVNPETGMSISTKKNASSVVQNSSRVV